MSHSKPLINGYESLQLFNRKSMALLWDKRSQFSPTTISKLKALYDNKSRGTLGCKTKIRYNLTGIPGQLGYGRYSSTKGSLETIDCDIRHTLCKEYYQDIDIVNCQPVLAVQFAKQYNVQMPYLSIYNANRASVSEEIASLLKFTSGEIKALVISLMFGAKLSESQSRSVTLRNIKNEVDTLIQTILDSGEHNELYEYVKRDKKPNPKGSFFAYILQTEERRCLEQLVFFFKMKQFNPDVLCYDGIMIRNEEDKVVSDQLLRECEEAVKTSIGYDIALKIKPMDNFIELEELVDDDILDEDVNISEHFAALHYIKIMTDNIVKEDNNIFIYNLENGMWEMDILHQSISKAINALCFKQKTHDGIKTYYFANSWKSISAIANIVRIELPESNFISTNSNASLGFLLFKNGHFDIKNKTFIPEFDKQKVFTARINEIFYEKKHLDIKAELNQALFINPLANIEVGEYLKHIISRSIFGKYQDKRFYSMLGNPNCGKGTITIGLNNAFGKYMGEWNINNLKYNPRSGNDEAKKLAWLHPMINVRSAFSNEGRMDKTSLDGNLIKTMASGGDGICIRQNFKDENIHILPTTFFYFGNDMPTIAPLDSAVQSRIRFIRFVKTFVNKPLSECNSLEMPADMDLKDKLKTYEYKSALFWLIMDAYSDTLMEDPIAVKEETAENAVSDEINLKSILNEEYEITGSEDDYVTSREIIEFIHSRRIMLSDAKIGRELRSIGLNKKDKKIDGKAIKVYVGLKR